MFHPSDQEIVRRNELEQLRAQGVEPYPAAAFPRNATAQSALDAFAERPEAGGEIALAGRLMYKRVMGKASFGVLEDAAGKIQIYVARDDIAPGEDKFAYNTLFKKLLSTGDFVGVKGEMFETQTGEPTLRVRELTILSKTLRPLPMPKEKDGEVYDAFTDKEQRYRMRYVDLAVNPQNREIFIKRARLYDSMRRFLNERGCLEVETPVLQPTYGGAYARPFTTHHNTLEQTLYLRIANELYLKRLIVGGFESVYEFAKDFRNEGMSRFHNPEFTQIELYVAYQDYYWMMDLVEAMLEQAALDVNGSTQVKVGDNVIDFKRPWKRYTMYGAIKEFAGIDVAGMDATQLLRAVKDLGISYDGAPEKINLIDEIFGEKVEPNLIQPTFITDYPLEMSPLAKKHRENPELTERFEVVCNCKEIANAYSELNDPVDQRARFEEQARLRSAGDEEAMMFDEDFVRALEYGMPPTTGLGIGLDRLAMILTNSDSIQEVLLFPQMRPEPREEGGITRQELTALGVPESWQGVLVKSGARDLDELAEANPQKLHKQMKGWQQKLSLDLPPLSADEVRGWIEAAQARREPV